MACKCRNQMVLHSEERATRLCSGGSVNIVCCVCYGVPTNGVHVNTHACLHQCSAAVQGPVRQEYCSMLPPAGIGTRSPGPWTLYLSWYSSSASWSVAWCYTCGDAAAEGSQEALQQLALTMPPIWHRLPPTPTPAVRSFVRDARGGAHGSMRCQRYTHGPHMLKGCMSNPMRYNLFEACTCMGMVCNEVLIGCRWS